MSFFPCFISFDWMLNFLFEVNMFVPENGHVFSVRQLVCMYVCVSLINSVWVLLLLWLPSVHQWFQNSLVLFCAFAGVRGFSLKFPPLLSVFASLCVCTVPQDSLCSCFSPADFHCLFFGARWPCSGGVVEFSCCPAPGLVLGRSSMPPQSFSSSFPGQSTLSTISLEGFVQDSFVPLLQ